MIIFFNPFYPFSFAGMANFFDIFSAEYNHCIEAGNQLCIPGQTQCDIDIVVCKWLQFSMLPQIFWSFINSVVPKTSLIKIKYFDWSEKLLYVLNLLLDKIWRQEKTLTYSKPNNRNTKNVISMEILGKQIFFKIGGGIMLFDIPHYLENRINLLIFWNLLSSNEENCRRRCLRHVQIIVIHWCWWRLGW